MVQSRHYLTLRQPELKWMQRTVTSMELGLFIAQVAGMNWEEMDLMVRSMNGLQVLAILYGTGINRIL